MPEFDPVFDLNNIDGTNGFRILGPSASDNFGRPATVIGDINGDGIDDMVFGARDADFNDRGAAYVVFGGNGNFASLDAANGPVDGLIDINDLDGTNGFAFIGNVDNANVGLWAAGAGDVDGDGFDDLIIGGSNAGGPNNSGRAFLVFGAASFTATVDANLDGTDGYVISGVGTNTSEDFGYSVSSAGDFNGDGFDDILIGARNADPLSGGGNTNEGAAYLILGGDANLIDIDNDDGVLNGSILISNLDNSEGASFAGEPINDAANLGKGISAAGDINGDGFDDFIVGSPYADPTSGAGNENEGASYIVFGRADMTTLSFPEQLAFSTGLNSVELRGVNAQDRAGFDVGGGGDVNGDGFDDFIVGALRADGPGGSSSGSAYVVFGKSAWGGAFELSSLNGTNGFRVDGLRGGDYTGIAVGMAGDINGDGFDDVAIGAHFYDRIGYNNVGAVYIVFGKADGFAPVIDLGALDGDNGFRVVGPSDSSAVLGRGITGPSGDVNGDGFDDLILGAYFEDTVNGSSSGAGYILFGHKAQGSVTRIGTHLDQTQNGGFGDDIIYGYDGNDRLFGHEGDDQLFGGAGDDFLSGGTDLGRDTMEGGSGLDTFIASLGDDTIDGGSGFDTLDLSQLTGVAAGVNLNLMGEKLTLVDGGLQSVKSIEKAIGTTAADTLQGGHSNNQLNGADGNDIIRGASGNDTLKGQNGDDNLNGGDGNDTLFGNVGNDILNGAGDNDILHGASGNDSLFGNFGNDILNGGTDDDLLRGNEGQDLLNGDDGSDDLRGGDGQDGLNGGDGADFLFGEAGNDILDGGPGDDADSMTGGTGADLFIYKDAVDGGGGFDRIKDFENGIDVMNLQSFGFGSFAAVQALASNSGSGLRIDFGGGDVLFVENFQLADFDAGNVLL